MSEKLELTPANVKATMKEAGATSADLWQVNFDDLYILPGFNVREKDAAYKGHIEYLASSMMENGYMRDKPMAGYTAVIEGKNRIVVTDGHCRYEAVGLAISRGAEISKIPVVVKPNGTSMEDLIVALVTSNSGKALSPYEMGTVCKRLIGFGWEEKQVAKRLGVSEKYVGDLLFLHSCPSAVRKMVTSGKVSADTAISTVKKHGDKAHEVLGDAIQKAEAKGKTKATKKDLTPDFNSECKKRGPKFHEALMWVKEDRGYKNLTDATREYINSVLEGMPKEPEKS